MFAGALMRIENQNLNGAAGLQTGQTPEVNRSEHLGSGSSSRVSSNGGDHAEISSLAENVSQTLSAQSVNRAQRIQQLTLQVRDGAYKPSAAAVSSSIVNDAVGGKDAAQ